MFSKVTLGNTLTCRTEAELSGEDGNAVALVYEARDGWHVEVLRDIRPDELDDFSALVATAKQDFSHYINRMGVNPPEDLTCGGLSLWLMQKDDGTVLGIKLSDSETEPSRVLEHISPDIENLARSLAREGRQIEAIRELRRATNCSLREAKAWLSDRDNK